MFNNKTYKPFYIIFSNDLAKYLALNGVVWEEVKISNKDSSRIVFLYEDTENLHTWIQKYKHQKEQQNNEQVGKTKIR